MSTPYVAGSPTSHAAALSKVDDEASELERVRSFIVACGEDGATDEECQRALRLGANTQRPRRVWLVQHGLVKDSGRRRTTTSARDAVVWIACNEAPKPKLATPTKKQMRKTAEVMQSLIATAPHCFDDDVRAVVAWLERKGQK